MIQGIGCDIINIVRIKAVIDKFGDRFLNRIYTANEINYASTLNNNKKISYLAKRFAAKEAIAKALGTGISKEISFNDIEILNDLKRSPVVKIRLKKYQHLKFMLSLADEKEFAIAYAIIIK